MLTVGAPVRSYGGKSAEARAEDRRARLVEATITVLAAQGAATTMTAICAEAGLTERYFYESFAHRDDALLAALDAVCEEIAARALTALEDGPGTPEERVHAMLAWFVEWVGRERDRGLVAVVQASATPRLRARRHELLGTFADLVALESTRLYGEHAWPPDRARLQGLVYIAGFAELLAAWLLGEIDLTPDELATTGSDLFLALGRRDRDAQA
jgi:AcrR family transcriptional regulator